MGAKSVILKMINYGGASGGVKFTIYSCKVGGPDGS